MKKVFVLILSIIMIHIPTFAAQAAVPADLESEAAVLIDRDSGQVLFNKNMNRKMYPASTTKIMTALLVVENCRPYEIVTVSESALDIDEPDSSNIALVVGEEFTVEQGLYALMLPSANDVANALAEHVAGSQKAFAEMMTAKAREIGAKDSNFLNAHGLHEDGHYTTAYDLAIITRYAMQNEEFRVYFGAARYTMAPTNKNSERPFTNYQYMLVRETDFYNPIVTGGKVGYTLEAMHTMSTAAQDGNRSLICVVMHSDKRNSKFSDTEKLLRFGFDEFTPVTVSKDEFSGLLFAVQEEANIVGSVEFFADDDFTALIHNSADIPRIRYERPAAFDVNMPISCDALCEILPVSDYIPSILGRVSLTPELSLTGILSDQQTDPDENSGLISKIKNLLGSAFSVIAFLLLALVLVAFIFILYRRHRLLRLRRRRQARLKRRAAYSSSGSGVRPPVSMSRPQASSRSRSSRR